MKQFDPFSERNVRERIFFAENASRSDLVLLFMMRLIVIIEAFAGFWKPGELTTCMADFIIYAEK